MYTTNLCHFEQIVDRYDDNKTNKDVDVYLRGISYRLKLYDQHNIKDV